MSAKQRKHFVPNLFRKYNRKQNSNWNYVNEKVPYRQKIEFQDCQGFSRTGKNLSIPGPVLRGATFSLTSQGPIFTSPGDPRDRLPRTGTPNNSKTDSGLKRL